MNLQAIIIANITGFILILFLHISRFISKTKSDTEENAFNAMMYLVMVACLIEPLTFYVDGKPGVVNHWINLLGNTYLYYANAVGTFLWLLYTDLSLFHDRKRIARIYYKLSIPVSILIASLVVNIWGKFYFYVDNNNDYHRLPSVYIFYGYLAFCAVYTLVLYYSYKSKHGETAFFPVYMYLTPILIGSILQMLFFGVSLAWLGTSLGIVALHLTLQQQLVYKDELTGLYNRLYLKHILFKMRKNPSKNYYGLMIDLNDFKGINDRFGHSMGDQALVDVAAVLRASLNDDSLAFRYAGDEFIIITRTNRIEDVVSLEKNVQSRLSDYNITSDKPYHLSLAIGHDRFDSEKDTDDAFLKKIDIAMYRAKKEYHENV